MGKNKNEGGTSWTGIILTTLGIIVVIGIVGGYVYFLKWKDDQARQARDRELEKLEQIDSLDAVEQEEELANETISVENHFKRPKLSTPPAVTIGDDEISSGSGDAAPINDAANTDETEIEVRENFEPSDSV